MRWFTKVTEFLNHLNGLHNKIHFTIKKGEKATFHSWTLMSTKNGELLTSPSVPEAHPYHSLPTSGLTSPPCKQSVLTALIHRAIALCNQDSLTQELEFLTTFSKNNGHSTQQI
jgi:hypothetical protein